MSDKSCPKCGNTGEVIYNEPVKENGKKFFEKILGCCECGHTWNVKEEAEK